MSDPLVKRLFISAVSAEFGSYRKRLAEDLQRPNLDVRVQEDFIVTGGTTLEKLDDYIRICDGVVHLVGDATGAIPPKPDVKALLDRLPELPTRFPWLADALAPGSPGISYTQWEAYLAIYHGKPLFVYLPRPEAPRDPDFQPDPDEKHLQKRHLQRIRDLGQDRGEFGDQAGLSIQVLRSLPDVLASGPPHAAAAVDAVLDRYCRERVREWEAACADTSDPDKLTHYVEPHYSLLQEGFSPADASSRLPRGHADGEQAVADPHRPVAEEGDSPEVELRKLVEAGRLLCVTEDAGAGKTIFTRRLAAFLCSAEAREALFEGKPPLVARWESRWPDDYPAALSRQIRPALNPQGGGVSAEQVVRTALDEGRVVLILDALDQLSDNSRLAALSHFLTTADGRRCRVVLTSRSYAVSSPGHAVFHDNKWRYGRIDPLTREQQEEYLWDLCKGQLWRLFPNYEEVSELLGVPVVLRIARDLVEHGQPGHFETRGELYFQACDRMIRRTAARSANSSRFRARVQRLEEILAAVAFQMMVDGRYDYAVRGAHDVDRLRENAARRCSVAITDDHWQMVEEATGLTNRCLLEASTTDMLSFKHRGMMEFYCGMFLARNKQPGWAIARNEGDEAAPPGSRATVVRPFANDENWYWAWRFAIELPEVAQETETLCASLAALYECPHEGRRPTELIYRAWPVLEGSVPGRTILNAFRDQFRGLGAASNSVALQLVAEQSLVEMGILSQAEADQIPPAQRNFVRCPPSDLAAAQPFWMGSAEGDEESDDERPRHRVVVAPFQLQRTAVTRAQYRLFDPEHDKAYSDRFDHYAPDDACPVIEVSWYASWVFARWIGGRLPTEAEWEYACRAGSTTKWCFGDSESQLGDYAWCGANSSGTTHPVGQKTPNAWGLYDMHGNVDEWCSDWYHGDYYAESPSADPTGPSSGLGRVLRGGSWFMHAGGCRSAYRDDCLPELGSHGLGFRVCLPPDGSSGIPG